MACALVRRRKVWIIFGHDTARRCIIATRRQRGHHRPGVCLRLVLAERSTARVNGQDGVNPLWFTAFDP